VPKVASIRTPALSQSPESGAHSVSPVGHFQRLTDPARLSALAAYGMYFEDGQTPLTPSAAPATRALSGELVREAVLIRRQPKC
jgi:hypothetical protein